MYIGVVLVFIVGNLYLIEAYRNGESVCITNPSGVNVRRTACGTKSGLAEQNKCFEYRGSSTRCRLGSRYYNFIKINYNGAIGWIASEFTRSGNSGGNENTGQYTCNGDIDKLTPTGASWSTAQQDSLSYTGVSASRKLVDNDLAELNKRKACYEQLGRKFCLQPSLIAAIASRETRGGRLLYNTGGWGDYRNGKYQAYGILQCDIDHSGLRNQCTRYTWDSCDHMDMMVDKVVMGKIRCVQQKKSNWPKEKQLQGGVAAYNFGCSNVWSWGGLDQGSTGDDYSNDVIARAQYLKDTAGWD